MKIRTNYVSNSSSSSFIIKKFDKEKILELGNKFIDQMNEKDKDFIWYKGNKNELKNIFIKKLEQDNCEQKRLFNIYLDSIIFSILESLYDYYENKRYIELNDCTDCEFYDDFNKNDGECRSCYFKFKIDSLSEQKEFIDKSIAELPEIDFSDVIKNIEEENYSFPVIEKDGEYLIKADKSNMYEFCFNTFNKYKEIWLKKNQENYILSFASDEGNLQEALLRCKVQDMKKFFNEHGIEGILGENS